MGTVELLTREGEIEIARRIEEGRMQVHEAICLCPATFREIMHLGERVIEIRDEALELEEDPNFKDILDIDDKVVNAAAIAQYENRMDKSEGDDDDLIDTKPKMSPEALAAAIKARTATPDGTPMEETIITKEEQLESALEHFDKAKELHVEFLKIRQERMRKPRDKKLAARADEVLNAMLFELVTIPFSNKRLIMLVARFKSNVDRVRKYERAIRDQALKAKMPRKLFLETFPTRLTDAKWSTDMLKQNPDAKIRYLHAERYVSDVVKAYENKAFDAFKKQYHSLDLLLIDDIQFFGKKTRTQEEFFYAFNTLIEEKKQIVITCDTYPKEITDVDERLRTRFSWGLTVAVEPPELEMRVAILLKKAEESKINLHEDVAFFVAKQIRSSVRELEGALNRIVAMAKFTGNAIDVHLAKDALRDLIAVRGRQITIENIQKTVADYYKIKVAEMHSKKRSRNFSRPRQVAMSLARELTNHSFPEIGEAFGNRHHTTVMHACDEIEQLRLNDQNIARDIGFLTQVIRD